MTVLKKNLQDFLYSMYHVYSQGLNYFAVCQLMRYFQSHRLYLGENLKKIIMFIDIDICHRMAQSQPLYILHDVAII